MDNKVTFVVPKELEPYEIDWLCEFNSPEVDEVVYFYGTIPHIDKKEYRQQYEDMFLSLDEDYLSELDNPGRWTMATTYLVGVESGDIEPLLY